MGISFKKDLSLRLRTKRGLFTERFLAALLIALLLHSLPLFLFKIDLFRIGEGETVRPYTEVVSEWENPGIMLSGRDKAHPTASPFPNRPTKKPSFPTPEMRSAAVSTNPPSTILTSVLDLSRDGEAPPPSPFQKGSLRFLGIHPLNPPRDVPLADPHPELPLVYTVVVDKKKGRLFWFQKESGGMKEEKKMTMLLKNLKFAIDDGGGFIKGKIELGNG